MIFCGLEGRVAGGMIRNVGVGAVEFFGIVGVSGFGSEVRNAGTSNSCSTVSIHHLEVMKAAWAFGPCVPGAAFVTTGVCVPARNDMFAVPPPLIKSVPSSLVEVALLD